MIGFGGEVCTPQCSLEANAYWQTSLLYVQKSRRGNYLPSPHRDSLFVWASWCKSDLFVSASLEGKTVRDCHFKTPIKIRRFFKNFFLDKTPSLCFKCHFMMTQRIINLQNRPGLKGPMSCPTNMQVGFAAYFRKETHSVHVARVFVAINHV